MTKWAEEERELGDMLDSLAGKTIARVWFEWREAKDRGFGVMTIALTEGSEVKLATTDSEGYSSSLQLWEHVNARERDSWLANR